MSERLSELFSERLEIITEFCDDVGATHLTADQGIELVEKLGIKISSFRGVLSRLTPAIKIKAPIAEMQRKLHLGKLQPSRKQLYNYFPRSADQGDPANGFCPRCKELNGRQVALTQDMRGRENFIYCAGCAWEEGWEANGLALTATI